MKKITFCAALLLFCLGNNIFSQKTQHALTQSVSSEERCVTMEALEQRMINDADYAAFRNAALAIPSIVADAARIACDGSNTIRVPVAFHFDEGFNCGDVNCVLTEVNDQLAVLNDAFGDNTGTPQEAVCPQAYQDGNGNSVASTGTCIEFYMPVPPAATGLDACDLPITLGQFNGGLNGGGSGAGSAWAGIMNIFITNNQCLGVADGIPGAANGDGVTVCQQAFGGTGGPSNACGLDTDNTFGLGATLTHEIGHYLGLYHTFQGGCGNQEPNPPGPFDVLDTPAHSNPTSGTPNGCVNSGCNGGVTPTANFMDYTNDAGMSMFTEDQAQVMNYWANQLFGGNSLADADPNGSINTACGNACNVVCPTTVQTAYSGAEDLCAALGTYTLPTDFSSVVLDNSSSATFTWSTGNYISAGGTAVTGTTINLTNPATCAPVTETYYLNTGCTDNSIQEIDAGTIVLTIYPDPTQFAVTDLVTFTDGVCDAPTWTATAGCAPYLTVTQNGGPTFPVASGASGTVDYDVTLAYPAECCSVPGGDIILTGTIGSTTLNNANDTQPCQNGTQPAVWEIPFTVPTAQNATTINTTGLGSITEVCLDITLNNTDAVNLTLDSPDCGGYEWEDLWLGSAFNGGSNTGPITVCFTPGTANGEFDGTFDGNGNTAAGADGSFANCDVNANQWVLYIADYNCYVNGGATGGTINSATVSFNDGTGVGQPGLCDFTATAAYNCSVACANVDLSITFDGNPDQTSWEIIDVADGSQVGAGGAYTSEAPNSTLALNPVSCLMDGCYELTFYDAADDGMCPRRTATVLTGINIATLGLGGVFNGLPRVGMMCGNYTLTDAAGTTIAVGGGRFGTSETTSFCISGGVLQPLIYEPDNVYARQSTFDNNSIDMWITPTLTSDAITIYSTLDETVDAQISVVNINGKIMQQHSQERNTARDLRLNVSDLPSGIYFVQMVANDIILVEKFVKK